MQPDATLLSRQDTSSVDTTPGSFRELSAHEFEARKTMRVIVVKAAHGASAFRGFRDVVAVADCKGVDEVVAGWPEGTEVGLVCPDGGCSSRLAIRLSRHGFQVNHLAGGLQEWYQTFPGRAVAAS